MRKSGTQSFYSSNNKAGLLKLYPSVSWICIHCYVTATAQNLSGTWLWKESKQSCHASLVSLGPQLCDFTSLWQQKRFQWL